MVSIATILGLIKAIYPSNPKPQLVVKVISEETVLNSKPLKDFTLGKENLLITKLDSLLLSEMLDDVKIITLRIENVGDAFISENLYDTKRPFGIGLGMGHIISAPNFITSNKELKSLLEKESEIQSPYKIFFPKLTLNSGEKFDMQILVSVYSDFVRIYSLGKIACQDSIPIKIKKNVNYIIIGTSKDPYYYMYDYEFDTSDDTYIR